LRTQDKCQSPGTEGALGKTDRRTWTPLGFEADEADFNITFPTVDDKSSCLGTIGSSALCR
jgi:hypothetical protein